MPTSASVPLLEALLDSWDRNNRILVNLLRAIPEDALDLRPMSDSPSIRGLFAHIHYCRLIFLQEDVPELARPMPDGEWRTERDRVVIVARLNVSAAAMRDAVVARLQSG